MARIGILVAVLLGLAGCCGPDQSCGYTTSEHPDPFMEVYERIDGGTFLLAPAEGPAATSQQFAMTTLPSGAPVTVMLSFPRDPVTREPATALSATVLAALAADGTIAVVGDYEHAFVADDLAYGEYRWLIVTGLEQE